MLKRLGEGSFGFVVAAKDSIAGKRVAIKKIKDAVEDDSDGKRLLRELKLLRHCRGHENFIIIKDIILSPSSKDFKDIYIVTDLMDTDLYRIVRSPQPLSDDHVRYFVYQVLRGLKFIHSANVMHRDLKPNNLLVNANCDLKICDLGLARMSDANDSIMTCYVVTRQAHTHIHTHAVSLSHTHAHTHIHTHTHTHTNTHTNTHTRIHTNISTST